MPSIRPATAADVPAFAQIINDCAEYGLMLHRSFAFLYEHIRDFQVAEEDGQVIGCCGLTIIWANMAEVASLAVHPDHRGKGLGGQLVNACIEDARRLGIKRIISLTYEQAFFERLDFKIIDRQKLPLKVWSECLRCAKNQACDEIAMMRELEDLPDLKAPQPMIPASDKYVVPVTLKIGQRAPQQKMDEMPKR